jgi:hypothetical protein
MFDVISKRCKEKGCKAGPCYNYEGEKKAIYCSKHQKENMFDVISKRCKEKGCDIIVNNDKYKGYCLQHFMHTYPDLPVSRNYKVKEFSVVNYVKNEFKNEKWIANKTISGGNSPQPDLLCYVRDQVNQVVQVLIIEIDENQHDTYKRSCEKRRENEISKQIGKPMVMIRFNPDGYMCGSKKITSCWGVNKKGIRVIKKSKVNEWNNRLKKLGDTIKRWLHPDKPDEKKIIHLFYNDE